MRVRGYETVTAGNLAAPLAVAGSMIRYGFYLVGMLVLGLIGLGVMALWKIPPKAVNAPPAFRIAASGLEQLAESKFWRTPYRRNS